MKSVSFFQLYIQRFLGFPLYFILRKSGGKTTETFLLIYKVLLIYKR